MVLLEELESVRFLRDLTPADLKQVASLARLQEYPAGAVIFSEGQATPSVFLVLQGEAALEGGVPGRGAVRVQTVGPGDLLGWSPVLGLGPMTATARAVSRCRLAALEADRVLALCAHDPQFGVAFLRCTAVALAQRLQATRRQLAAAPPQGERGASAP